MSYSITVHSVDGQLRIEHSEQVPDGTHVISGHEDERYRTLGVTRSNAENHPVSVASVQHSKEH